eukprot:UN06359
MESIYWIGFIIKTFVINTDDYDKYSFLFYIATFLPIIVFHILLIYYAKIHVPNIKPMVHIQQPLPYLDLVNENDTDSTVDLIIGTSTNTKQ